MILCCKKHGMDGVAQCGTMQVHPSALHSGSRGGASAQLNQWQPKAAPSLYTERRIHMAHQSSVMSHQSFGIGVGHGGGGSSIIHHPSSVMTHGNAGKGIPWRSLGSPNGHTPAHPSHEKINITILRQPARELKRNSSINLGSKMRH